MDTRNKSGHDEIKSIFDVIAARTHPITPRINIVTLGVSDIAAATAFYEKRGFRRNDVYSFFTPKTPAKEGPGAA